MKLEAIRENILRYRKEVVVAVAVFLISTTSYALGYLTARDARAPIIIEQCSEGERIQQ